MTKTINGMITGVKESEHCLDNNPLFRKVSCFESAASGTDPEAEKVYILNIAQLDGSTIQAKLKEGPSALPNVGDMIYGEARAPSMFDGKVDCVIAPKEYQVTTEELVYC